MDYEEKERKRIERYLGNVLNESKRVFEEEFPEYKDEFEIVFEGVTKGEGFISKGIKDIPWDRLPAYGFFLRSKSNPKDKHSILILLKEDLTKRKAKIKNIHQEYSYFVRDNMEKELEKVAGDRVFRRGLKERITKNKTAKKIDKFVTLYYREEGTLFKGINWDNSVVFFYHNLKEGEAFLIVDRFTPKEVSLLNSLTTPEEVSLLKGWPLEPFKDFEKDNCVNFSYLEYKNEGCGIKLMNTAVRFMKKSGMFKDIKFVTFLHIIGRVRGRGDLKLDHITNIGQGYYKKHVRGVENIPFGYDKHNPRWVAYARLR